MMLSHVIGRLPGAAATSLALLVMSAGPAHGATIAGRTTKAAKGMVSANDVQSVIDYLSSKGVSVTQDESDVGNPMLSEGNQYYDIFFSCEEDHTSCKAIEFRACYSNYPQAGLDQANTLSRDDFFIKSYIDQENRICIEKSVVTGLKGISYEAMDVAFDAFTGCTEDCDFGADASEESFDEATEESDESAD